MAKNNRPIVYSTNPDFNFESDEANERETILAKDQTLYLSLERIKGGKVATIIENFIGKTEDLETLGKQLKTKCGVGGSVKDGIIIIQGDNRDKAMLYLQSLAYKVKKKGG